MIVYPLIELQGGRCVSLYRGRLDAPHIWHVDPVEKARKFHEAGAEWLHITDFDAIAGDDRNRDLVDEIIRSSGLQVQLGGGIRSLQAMSEAIERGAARVVVGTLAVLAPDLVKEAAKFHPDQIVLAVDVYRGRVLSDGWRTPSAFDPASFIAQFQSDPLAAIVVTDIDADLEEAEDSLALVTELAGLSRAPVIACGLARTPDDVSRLRYVPHVAGTIIGRALFDQSIDLEDALQIAGTPTERVAAFI